MEELVKIVVEQGIVAGAFVYMLHHHLTKVSRTLDDVSKTLIEVCTSIDDMNTRISRLEEK